MIEELQIVREIFGDLSAMGIWAIVAYFVYKLCVIGAWIGGIALIANLIKWIFSSHQTAYLESQKIGVDKDCEVVSARSERDEWKRKAEDCQHMYKILKEAKND